MRGLEKANLDRVRHRHRHVLYSLHQLFVVAGSHLNTNSSSCRNNRRSRSVSAVPSHQSWRKGLRSWEFHLLVDIMLGIVFVSFSLLVNIRGNEINGGSWCWCGTEFALLEHFLRVRPEFSTVYHQLSFGDQCERLSSKGGRKYVYPFFKGFLQKPWFFYPK